MGTKFAAVLLVLFSILLFTASSPVQTSFSSVELQVKNHTKNGIFQTIKEGHGGGGGVGGGHSGGEGEGNADSSSGGPPGRPLNGAGTAGTRNHIRHSGAGIQSSTYNLSMLTISITLILGLFCSL